MLTLTRREGEEIVVGEGPKRVVIRVTEIRGEKVRIRVDAHRSIPVHRREVFDQIEAKREAERAMKPGMAVGDPGRDLGM